MLEGVQVVEERTEDGLQRRLRRLQERAGAGAHVGRRRLQGGDQVSPEQAGIVVALVERQPCRRVSPGRRVGHPLGHERGLAETGRRRHERQRRLRDEVQALPQPGPLDHATSPPRDVELGLQQRARHPGASLLPRHHPMVAQPPRLSGRPGPGGCRARRTARTAAAGLPVARSPLAPSHHTAPGMACREWNRCGTSPARRRRGRSPRAVSRRGRTSGCRDASGM